MALLAAIAPSDLRRRVWPNGRVAKQICE